MTLDRLRLAARELFVELGYHETRPQDIARRASVANGTFYLHFADKQQSLQAKHWVDEYYSIIKSDECVPIGHTVNANIAMVTRFSLHQDREEATNRGLEGFEFFGYALGALYGFGEHKPGRTNLFKQFREAREKQLAEMPVDITESLTGARGGIGTPDDMRGPSRNLRKSVWIR